MAESPTQRTIRYLRNQGRRCGIVEKFNAHIGPNGVRQDLFGIIDVIALDPEQGVVGVQCCAGSGFAEHYRKITEERAEDTIEWLRTPFTKLEIHAWSKRLKKRGGKAMVWTPRIREVVLADLWADGAEWRPIEGYEGTYEVSSAGNVRSLERSRTRTVNGKKQVHNVAARILSPSSDDRGALRVNLKLEGSSRSLLVHRLVAEAFIDNPERKPQINHKDGNPSNNSVDNLEWMTNSENAMHATRVLGKVRGFVKLTVEDVREIRRLAVAGIHKKEIALRFDICEITASNIIRRKRWPNV